MRSIRTGEFGGDSPPSSEAESTKLQVIAHLGTADFDEGGKRADDDTTLRAGSPRTLRARSAIDGTVAREFSRKRSGDDGPAVIAGDAAGRCGVGGPSAIRRPVDYAALMVNSPVWAGAAAANCVNIRCTRVQRLVQGS
jgi:hypothetical protein